MMNLCTLFDSYYLDKGIENIRKKKKKYIFFVAQVSPLMHVLSKAANSLNFHTLIWKQKVIRPWK